MLTWQGSGGFSVDASVRIEAEDRAGIERLVRYCARQPFALERLHALDAIPALASPDSRLLYGFPKPDVNGRTELLLTPLELLECLATTLRVVPSSRHRASTATATTACWPRTPGCGPTSWPSVGTIPRRPCPSGTPSHLLLARIYDVLPLLCPACGRQMNILAFLTDPPVVSAILLHLDLPHKPPPTSPARGPPQSDLLVELLDQSPPSIPPSPSPSRTTLRAVPSSSTSPCPTTSALAPEPSRPPAPRSHLDPRPSSHPGGVFRLPDLLRSPPPLTLGRVHRCRPHASPSPSLRTSPLAQKGRFNFLSVSWHTPARGLRAEASAFLVDERQEWRSGQLGHFVDNRQWSARLESMLDRGAHRLSATLYATAFEHLSRTSPGAEPVPGTGDEETQRLVEGELLYGLDVGRHALDAGLEVGRESIRSGRVRGGHRTETAGESFVQTTLAWGGASIVPGVRGTWSEL